MLEVSKSSPSLNDGPGRTSRRRSFSQSVSHRAGDLANLIESEIGGVSCGCCRISGNALALLTSAVLFGLITVVQYIYAIQANSLALQADCVSMAVDSFSFFGNLGAECAPAGACCGAPPGACKRRLQLVMSGLSHTLLLGFTIYFLNDAVGTLESTEESDVDPIIVLIFACGGILFDVISLGTYFCFGERSKKKAAANAELLDPETGLPPAPVDEEDEPPAVLEAEPDALTCGINTNMCAALLHVLSDLGRSVTTLIESIVLFLVPSIPGNKADGVSALIICSTIALGAFSAVLVWMREVYVYVSEKAPASSEYQQMAA